MQTIITNVKNVGLIDDVANGFKASAGHLGTHTKEYVRKLDQVLGGLTTEPEIRAALDQMRTLILNGTFK